MTVAVPYHRLFRTLPGYRWWRPLVAILLGSVFLIVASVLVALIGVGIGIATGEVRTDSLEHLQSDILALTVLDAASPLRLFVALGSIAILLPCVQLAILCAGLRPISVRHSVEFRVRWRWLFFSLLPALVIIGVTFGISYGLVPLFDGEWLELPTTDLSLFAVCAVIIVLLTPLQAAAEEYVFRGLLAQAVGAWIRYVPFAIVIPTIAFASLHGYDWWGLADVFVFGFAASVVVWRTGGLEAGIAMHTVNNVAIFLLLASGSLGTTVNESTAGSPISLGISIVTMVIWVAWMSSLARRRGLADHGAAVRPRAANVLE
ncbi:MAG TPA: type II CAAX endopeptidase family protein [Pseudolysinimonas sp.]